MVPSGIPEFDWLLVRLRAVIAGCKKTGWSPADRASSNPDWKRLLEFARWHVLAPCLALSVARAAPNGDVPDEARKALCDDFAANAAAMERLTAELVPLMNELQAADIRALPFKGPLLATKFYPDANARKCENLNLLIEPAALSRASAVLSQRGYHFVPVLKVDAAAQWHIEANVRFYHPGTGIEVCLNSQVVPRRYSYQLSFDRLWRRAHKPSPSSPGLPCLSNEDWLILASLYSSKDGFWPSLSLVCDIAWVLAASDGIDWDDLRKEARRLKCERVVLLALALTQRLLGTELPGDWQKQIESDPVVTTLRERVCERLARGETGFITLPDAIRTHYALRQNALDKLRYATGVMITPSVRDFQFFGRPVSVPASYAVRAVKLAGKCVWQVLGRFVPASTRRPAAMSSVRCGL